MPKAESKSKKARAILKRKYSHEQMLAALDAFKDKPSSNIRQTARNHKVPESTLRCYINRHKKGINVSPPKGATNRRLLMDAQ